MNPKQKIGWKTAATLVISSMVGTGMFAVTEGFTNDDRGANLFSSHHFEPLL